MLKYREKQQKIRDGKPHVFSQDDNHMEKQTYQNVISSDRRLLVPLSLRNIFIKRTARKIKQQNTRTDHKNNRRNLNSKQTGTQ